MPFATAASANSRQVAKDDLTCMKKVEVALRHWQERTNTPQNQMPTDVRLRNCDIAQELRLGTLISRAGGYRRVCEELDLTPMTSHRINSRRRQLGQLAFALEKVCRNHSLPPPHVSFPTRDQIRLANPVLANRIAAFPSRAGYTALAEFIQSRCPSERSDDVNGGEQLCSSNGAEISQPSMWGKMTSFNEICEQLAEHQPHANVMPSLKSLPTILSSAIQRKGGAVLFARRANLVDFKNFQNLDRLATLVKWLAEQEAAPQPTDKDPQGYLQHVQHQCEHPPSFPHSATIEIQGMLKHIRRFGGRRVLALRLGYDRTDVIRGLFMGPFSVQLAADVLDYARQKMICSYDGCVVMPSVEDMERDDLSHLASAVKHLGGEVVVGRRLGLVPLTLEPELLKQNH